MLPALKTTAVTSFCAAGACQYLLRNFHILISELPQRQDQCLSVSGITDHCVLYTFLYFYRSHAFKLSYIICKCICLNSAHPTLGRMYTNAAPDLMFDYEFHNAYSAPSSSADTSSSRDSSTFASASAALSSLI